MNKCLKVTKILLKTGGDSLFSPSKTKKKRVLAGQAALIVLLAACFVPLLFLLYRFGESMYQMFSPAGLAQLVYLMILLTLTMATLIFALPFIMSVMLFAKDLEYLLPLPLTSLQIAGSKFLTILTYEYATVAFMGIPMLLGVGMAAGEGILYWLMALVVLIFLPILPIAYGSLLGLLLLRLMKNHKNKESMTTVLSILLLIGVMAFSFLSSYLGDSLDEKMITDLLLSNKSLLTGIDYLFPNLRFARAALMNHDPVSLAVYVLIAAGILALYLLLSSRFYLNSIAGMNESSQTGKALSENETTRALRSQTTVRSCALREWKLLVRTPIYLMNCVSMPFILPLFLCIPIILEMIGAGGLASTLKQLHLLISSVDPMILHGCLLLLVFGLTALLTGMNLTIPTCISREGQNVYYMKYIPVPYRVQLRGKVLCGVLISMTAILPYQALLIGCSCYFFGTSLMLLIPGCLISILTILLISYLQLLGDLWHPKLVWTSEQVPVKQNMIAMLSVLLSYVVCLLLGAGAVLLYLAGVPILPLTAAFLLAEAVLALLLRSAVYRYGDSALEKLE